MSGRVFSFNLGSSEGGVEVEIPEAGFLYNAQT